MIQLIQKQTADAFEWVHKLIQDVPEDLWEQIPPNIGTHICWQVGHIIISSYYHSIMVIHGHHKELLAQIPIREYNQYFNTTPAEESIGKVTVPDLKQNLKRMQEASLTSIGKLADGDLDQELVAFKFPHPVAKTKYEALDWHIKHMMWHCGQMAILKRAVHERYDFGLRQ